MRFYGAHYNEQIFDPTRCAADVMGYWHGRQCERPPLPGLLRCKMHEAKDARIPADDPEIARLTVGSWRYVKLASHGWCRPHTAGCPRVGVEISALLDFAVALSESAALAEAEIEDVRPELHEQREPA